MRLSESVSAMPIKAHVVDRVAGPGRVRFCLVLLKLEQDVDPDGGYVCVCLPRWCGVLCGVMCCVRFCFVGRESANQDFGGIVLCQQFARARIVRVQAADAARGLQRLLCTPMLVCMCACLYLCTYLRVRARMYPLRMFVCLCMSYVHAWCVCKHASTSI